MARAVKHAAPRAAEHAALRDRSAEHAAARTLDALPTFVNTPFVPLEAEAVPAGPDSEWVSCDLCQKWRIVKCSEIEALGGGRVRTARLGALMAELDVIGVSADSADSAVGELFLQGRLSMLEPQRRRIIELRETPPGHFIP